MQLAWTGPQPQLASLTLAGHLPSLASDNHFALSHSLLNATRKLKSLTFLAYLVGHLKKVWSVILQGIKLVMLKNVRNLAISNTIFLFTIDDLRTMSGMSN